MRKRTDGSRTPPLKSTRTKPGWVDRQTAEDNRRTTLQLSRQGMSARQIAGRLGIAQRSVVRLRSSLRQEGDL